MQFLVCLQPARLGGESVLVSVASVFNYILEKAPEAIEVLSQDFLWENRGFADTFYAAPIFFRNKVDFHIMAKNGHTHTHKRNSAPWA